MTEPKPARVSHPLSITSDANGDGKAQLTVPFDMVLRSIRVYTTDPAGLRVCRLGIKRSGGFGSPFWSPIDESTEVLPPLVHLVPPDERPEDPCAFSGMELKSGSKWDITVQRLEGMAPYTVELTFLADAVCEE